MNIPESKRPPRNRGKSGKPHSRKARPTVPALLWALTTIGHGENPLDIVHQQGKHSPLTPARTAAAKLVNRAVIQNDPEAASEIVNRLEGPAPFRHAVH